MPSQTFYRQTMLARNFWKIMHMQTIKRKSSDGEFWVDDIIRALSSEFVSSSIPSWQILTAHAQPFRGARDLAFFLKVPLDSLHVWAGSGGSGETARMRRLARTFAAGIGDKYQIRLTRSIKCYDRIANCFACAFWLIIGQNFGCLQWSVS